ncbi:hypothetical protein [Nitrosomonas sp.]|uniref:hypothetical protein n=1 Tax=Nitrosomonas sp. TaxID=42353 RepID=UPI0025E4E08C|nr:hypothetical protein [Nitrosomonas sp.]
MSVKSFISAEAHLAKLGYSIKQANDFINANVGQAEIIFAAARENGVTTNMLNEISGHSTTVIREYFDVAGLNNKEVDYTSLLVNSDLGSLERLISFNERDGILSNSSLSDTVRSEINMPLNYDFTFVEYADFELNDGKYDAEELGVGHLVNVSATNESIESLFYGSIINIFSALDETELDQINTFPRNDDQEEFQLLILDALSESPTLIAWSEEELVDLVTSEAVNIIDKYWESNLVGVLDHSILGLATA